MAGKLSVDGKTYEFDEESLTNRECMEIEKVTGWDFGEFIVRLTQKGSARAITAAVYIAQKRENPDLRFDDVEFRIASVDLVEDEDTGKGEAGEPPAALKATSTNTSSRSRKSTGTTRTSSAA